MADQYEVAVYLEMVNDLAAKIKDLIGRETEEITDARVKNAIIAAAMGTAAQMLDGFDVGAERAALPGVFLADGVTGALMGVAKGWQK